MVSEMTVRSQVWVSPVRPRVIEALLSFRKLEAVRLEAYSSLETACCFSALKHLPELTHLDLRLSGSHYALADNLDALQSLAKCPRLVSPRTSSPHSLSQSDLSESYTRPSCSCDKPYSLAGKMKPCTPSNAAGVCCLMMC